MRKKTKTTKRSHNNTVYEHPTTKYALDVCEGRVIAGPIVRDACKRHLSDLERGADLGLYFDVDKANHALEFFPRVLRLNGGEFEGIPFNLAPPQEFIVGSLFGWMRGDKTRRFRFAYIEKGKGNGKSPLVAGIGLYGLVADKESRAEVYAAATKRDQAMILFRDAVAMVEQSPLLARKLRKSGRDDKVWNLYHLESGSFFRPISADDGQSGPRPHIGLIDELHEHKSPVIINMMAAGRKGRRQPLIIAITNSGHDRNSVCWEYHQTAIKVCSGEIKDDTFFGYVCALDKDDDPLNDESCWVKANPLLGVTIQPEYLRDEVNQARSMPSKESMVRRLNFCQWTEAHDPLIPMSDWEACGEEYTLDWFRGSEVYVGIDLSRTTDLTAVVFVMRKNGYSYWWPEFWLPKDGLAKRVETDKVPYDVWERHGHLRTTPGRAIDKDIVAKHILDIQSKYSLRFADAPYDKAFIEEFRMSCERVGLMLPLSEFQQGFISMAPAVNELETSILNGTLRHNKNPVLRMCAANTVVSQDPAGNRKFNKERATGRIDGIVAGAMAHLRAKNKGATAEPNFRWI